MKKTNRHIALFIIPIIAVGIIFSITHYHSESMKCLYHVDDQHITQNDLLCPVCAIFTADLELGPDSKTIFIHSDFIQPATVSPFSISESSHFLLRAPPALS